MLAAFAKKILKSLLVSVFTGRGICTLKSLAAFLVWVFLSLPVLWLSLTKDIVSIYFASFNSKAATGLTMLLLTQKRESYFTAAWIKPLTKLLIFCLNYCIFLIGISYD